MKLNHGDLKATRDDTGHAEIDMITSIYAHVLEPKAEPAALDLASLVVQLQKSPELAKTLAALISAQTGGRSV